MPSRHALLYPAVALAFWTFVVLLLIVVVRVRAARAGQVMVSDFRLGESARVPPHVALVNRNYMNLLELPMLFYVVLVLLWVTGLGDSTAITLAWAYVALRIVHSLVHITYNRVPHRLALFAASNGMLIALWVLLLQKMRG